ncbi:hypothetical protein [Streptomyces sp. VRA16 Mangrove soil]|uniref:hypothetical protein n=1 Tax=Streptomyces sp. VRA16 Mangrove soil TaxID=2817434 RepID=UPI001A9EB61F|nr:hypothetical protein [Streptomyces sp. VRA16 Mangrove soil]MBO1336447.1 hypothetical protein [Streptomyces sp. VRA16 Mangrove soil]
MLDDVVQGAVEGVVRWTLGLATGRRRERSAQRAAGRTPDPVLAAAEAGRPANLACALRWKAVGQSAFTDGWLRVNQGDPVWWDRRTKGQLPLPAAGFTCVERRIALPGEFFRGVHGTSFVLRLRAADGSQAELSVAAPTAPYVLRLLTGRPGVDLGK